VPRHERFTGAARATLQREIRATACAATNTACKRNQARLRLWLWLGDNSIDFDPASAIRSWSLGIAAF
jgi:hypothetical protein